MDVTATEEELNRISEIFRKLRTGEYIITPTTYKKECGVVTLGGGNIVDKTGKRGYNE